MLRFLIAVSLFVALFMGCNLSDSLIKVNGSERSTTKTKPIKLEPKETPVVKFTVQPDQMAKDLVDKGVAVGVFQQLWVFEAKQNIKLTVIQTKVVDDGQVVVAVSLSAVADVPKTQQKQSNVQSGTSVPQTPGKNSSPPQPQSDTSLPSTVRLKGVAKLFYEEIGDQWYLTGVNSVNLRLDVGK